MLTKLKLDLKGQVQSLDLEPVTLIVGPNRSGKTSILDAVRLLSDPKCLGRSVSEYSGSNGKIRIAGKVGSSIVRYPDPAPIQVLDVDRGFEILGFGETRFREWSLARFGRPDSSKEIGRLRSEKLAIGRELGALKKQREDAKDQSIGIEEVEQLNSQLDAARTEWNRSKVDLFDMMSISRLKPKAPCPCCKRALHASIIEDARARLDDLKEVEAEYRNRVKAIEAKIAQYQSAISASESTKTIEAKITQAVLRQTKVTADLGDLIRKAERDTDEIEAEIVEAVDARLPEGFRCSIDSWQIGIEANGSLRRKSACGSERTLLAIALAQVDCMSPKDGLGRKDETERTQIALLDDTTIGVVTGANLENLFDLLRSQGYQILAAMDETRSESLPSGWHRVCLDPDRDED